MIDLEKMTLDVCGIARAAGEYLRNERKIFSQERVEQKNSHDYVSYVDKTAEKQIVDALKTLLPCAGFITEEGSAVYADEEFFWVIDPLDGTTNYIHGNPPYAVSIGLRKGDHILIGVVYEVCLDECFYAWRNGGAYMNGKPVSVTDNDIDRALLCLELPYNYDKYGHTAHNLIRRFYGRAGGIRMNGSAAISLCYIAAGRLDGWLEMYINNWDFTAGALIVTEAGGKVTGFNGNENYLDGNNVVASNGVIHSELLCAVQERLPD